MWPHYRRTHPVSLSDPISPSEFHVEGETPSTEPAFCRSCGGAQSDGEIYQVLRVCELCGAMERLDAWSRISSIVDPHSFRETEKDLRPTDPLGFYDGQSYPERVLEQQAKTDLSEAMVTGTATISGHSVVLAVLDFNFLGGSMGTIVGEKLARAADLARERRRPLVTVVGSGGARMQEGILSLLQMAKTAGAIRRLQNSGVPYLSVLSDPTTGGVFASFASLGDVTIAEPRALIGFAGPRVAEQVIGRPLPPGSHRAEFHCEHGLIDAVVPRTELREYLGNALAVLAPGAHRAKPDVSIPAPLSEPLDPWTTVEVARDRNRPTSRDYIDALVSAFIEIRGDRAWGDDPNVVAGIGRISGQSVAIVGFERRRHPEGLAVDGRPRPEGFRKAQRLLRLAAHLQIPVITLVDTPGAYPGVESEERGLAGQIAETMALMIDVAVPTVAAIIGEGGSGGALAISVADRVLMQECAIYSVISPEGAAAILYRDAEQAPAVAKKLKLTAPDLLELGIIDRIVAEPRGGAPADPAAAVREMTRAINRTLDELQGRSRDRLLKTRRERYRRVGNRWIAGTETGTRAERVLRWAWDSRTSIRAVLPTALADRLPG